MCCAGSDTLAWFQAVWLAAENQDVAANGQASAVTQAGDIRGGTAGDYKKALTEGILLDDQSHIAWDAAQKIWTYGAWPFPAVKRRRHGAGHVFHPRQPGLSARRAGRQAIPEHYGCGVRSGRSFQRQQRYYRPLPLHPPGARPARSGYGATGHHKASARSPTPGVHRLRGPPPRGP